MKVFYFLSPSTQSQPNIGDHAQAYCLKNMLDNVFGNDIVIEYPNFPSASVLNEIEKEDIIILSSGGNLGDLWPPCEPWRRKIIERCKDNLIVSFPQTIEFLSEKEAGKSSIIYNAHPNLHLFVRDSKSYDLAKTLFNSCHVQLFPGPVLTLSYYKEYDRQDILCILRNDKECWLKEKRNNLIEICNECGFNPLVVDTNKSLPIDREGNLFSFLDEISHYKLVITDRFHGMKFSIITGTPCIVIPTINHKVTEMSLWNKKLGAKVIICDNLSKIKNLILSISSPYKYNSSLAKSLYYRVLWSIKKDKTVPDLNDVQNNILFRRTVRKWNELDLSNNLIFDIINTGVYAPTGSNSQCVRFKIIKDKSKIKTLCKMIWSRETDIPPVIILVGYDFSVEKTINFSHQNPTWEDLKFQDIAAAIQNMQLYCESIGLSCCWLSYFPRDRQDFLNSIGIMDNGIEYLSGLAIGFAKDKMVFEETHGNFSIKRKEISYYIRS